VARNKVKDRMNQRFYVWDWRIKVSARLSTYARARLYLSDNNLELVPWRRPSLIGYLDLVRAIRQLNPGFTNG